MHHLHPGPHRSAIADTLFHHGTPSDCEWHEYLFRMTATAVSRHENAQIYRGVTQPMRICLVLLLLIRNVAARLGSAQE